MKKVRYLPHPATQRLIPPPINTPYKHNLAPNILTLLTPNRTKFQPCLRIYKLISQASILNRGRRKGKNEKKHHSMQREKERPGLGEEKEIFL